MWVGELPSWWIPAIGLEMQSSKTASRFDTRVKEAVNYSPEDDESQHRPKPPPASELVLSILAPWPLAHIVARDIWTLPSSLHVSLGLDARK